MQQKMSLILPYEFEIVFQSLPLAEAGRLILAIYSYEQRKEQPNFSDNPMLQFAWETHIKPKIDENIEKYERNEMQSDDDIFESTGCHSKCHAGLGFSDHGNNVAISYAFFLHKASFLSFICGIV